MSEIIKKIINNKEYRIKTFFYISVITTTLFAIFNAFIGAYYKSIWYGSIATYFIALAILRIYDFIKTKFIVSNTKKESIFLIRNGIMILLIQVALTFFIIQAITSTKPIIAGNIVAIANAAYAFFKITVAIINILKAKKHKNSILLSIRCISLVDALVSMLSLTVTLLTTFGTSNEYRPFVLYTAITVSVLIITIASYMIYKGCKNIKEKSAL